MKQISAAPYSSLFVILAILASTVAADEGTPRPISFLRDVAPILVAKCQSCHGPKTAESNYRLDSFERMLQPGDFGLPPLTAGNLDESEIYRLITSDDADERMPNNGDRLTNEEIEQISNWIAAGAAFDGTDPAAPLTTQIPRDIPHPPAPNIYAKPIPITALALNADGSQLLTGGYHELLVWNAATGELLTRIGNIPQRTCGLAFSPDNTLLAVAGGAPGVSGEVRLIAWNGGPKPDALPLILATQGDVFFDAAFSRDGKQLVTGGADGIVRVFDVASGAERLAIESHADWVTDVCVSPDGKRIATASRDKTAKVFDIETGALLTTHSDHNAPVRAVAFSSDGTMVLSAGGNVIRIWNVADAVLTGELTGFAGEVSAIIASDNGVVATSADRSARLFAPADKSLVRAFADHPAPLLSLACQTAAHRLATGGYDGTVTIWNLEDGTQLKQFIAVPPQPLSPN